MFRSSGAAVLGGLLVVALAACGSSAPTDEELAGAEAARPAGIQTLAAIEIPTPTGWEQIAERNVDACGSMTNDRGGFDDAHINGYSCAVVRRTLYVRADGAATSRDDEAAWSATAELAQNIPELHLSDRVPNANGFLTVDGRRVRAEAFITEGENADIDILPLWHRNETIVTDETKLVDQLGEQNRAGDNVLQLTVTVPYFEYLRPEEEESYVP
ncbi:hypothetical protein L2X99_05495 [Microbacterium sp. KUDC0406]|uniref:hypothetical protein n=1 Tax=Microbacterium sp. KUDC0406 TaxID=2909588 RepID=UPI001F396933|nr:hypothetical protein [Microbacterium sp. KUDC0406]UJP11044.1 hypothetical protein L2X99_05495 [Microbacterium sp. KUDC0406]